MGVLSSVAEGLRSHTSMSYAIGGGNPHASVVAETAVLEADRAWRLELATEPLLEAHPVPPEDHEQQVLFTGGDTLRGRRLALHAASETAPVFLLQNV